jgi:hypothetical protein
MQIKTKKSANKKPTNTGNSQHFLSLIQRRLPELGNIEVAQKQL